jgi:hypothetical protein
LSLLFPQFKYFVAHYYTHGNLEVNFIFQFVSELGTLCKDLILECDLLTFTSPFIFIMSQNLNSISPFDRTNYGYWKARMRFFLKSIDVWKIVKTDWIKPKDTNEIEVTIA